MILSEWKISGRGTTHPHWRISQGQSEVRLERTEIYVVWKSEDSGDKCSQSLIPSKGNNINELGELFSLRRWYRKEQWSETKEGKV